jgi:mediator of replication checkpoint protein 1
MVNVEYHSTISPSPSKRTINAFDKMRLAQEKLAGKKLEKSEYVEAEAEESDDDDQFGFGGHRKVDDGEEEDGEDQDKTLEGLVDDAEMDDATMAEELVMEKVKYVHFQRPYCEKKHAD